MDSLWLKSYGNNNKFDVLNDNTKEIEKWWKDIKKIIYKK